MVELYLHSRILLGLELSLPYPLSKESTDLSIAFISIPFCSLSQRLLQQRTCHLTLYTLNSVKI
jgi:hypothetical protein